MKILLMRLEANSNGIPVDRAIVMSGSITYKESVIICFENYTEVDKLIREALENIKRDKGYGSIYIDSMEYITLD
jgi:hypothetical protein